MKNLSSSHPPTCTGCFECNAELAATMNMSPGEYGTWLSQQSAAVRQFLEARPAALRAAAGASEIAPPPSLADAIRQMREYRASTPPRLAAELTALAARQAVEAHLSRPLGFADDAAPRHAAASETIDPPPSLTAAILEHRSRR